MTRLCSARVELLTSWTRAFLIPTSPYISWPRKWGFTYRAPSWVELPKMLPAVGSLGSALLAVFAAKEIVEFAGHLHKLADDYNGVADAQKALNAAGQENASILEEQAKQSSTYARAQLTLLIVQAAQAEAATEQTRKNQDVLPAWEKAILQASVAVSTLGTSLAFTSKTNEWLGVAQRYYLGQSEELTEVIRKQTAAEKLRDDVLTILGVDVVKEGKATKEAEEKKQEAWERSTEQQYEYFAARRKVAEADFDWYVHLALEIDKLRERNAALREEVAFRLQLAAAETEGKNQLSIEEEMHRRLDMQVKLLLEHSKELRAEWDRLHPTAARMREELQLLGIDTQQVSARQLEFIGVENQVVGALDKELMAYGFKAKAMKGFLAEELRELAGFLTKKAHIKAIEQVAEALGSWPNYVAMGEHFAAAAAWEVLGAGVSGLAGAAAGSLGRNNGSQSSYGRSGGDRGAGSSDSGIPPQTVAQGAGGRFSGTARVVVFGTDYELQNWVAGAVNGAVQRGGPCPSHKLTARRARGSLRVIRKGRLSGSYGASGRRGCVSR